MNTPLCAVPALDGPSPVVAVPACRRQLDARPYHVVGEKYLLALGQAARAIPLVVPALGGGALPQIIARSHGLFLTGSPSNVEPGRYGGEASAEGTLHDPHRDATSFALIEAALAAGMPVLAVCRGLQELNVVLGGTLHQQVQVLPGMREHRETPGAPQDVQYGPAHAVNLVPGGLLAKLAGRERVQVNSLHEQGIDRLAAPARVEATADDGLVEAFRVPRPGQWILAVQWHPEWRVLEDPLSHAIFQDFGRACRAYASGSRDDLHRAVV